MLDGVVHGFSGSAAFWGHAIHRALHVTREALGRQVRQFFENIRALLVDVPCVLPSFSVEGLALTGTMALPFLGAIVLARLVGRRIAVPQRRCDPSEPIRDDPPRSLSIAFPDHLLDALDCRSGLSREPLSGSLIEAGLLQAQDDSTLFVYFSTCI